MSTPGGRSLYAYAVVPAGTVLAGVTGIDDRPLELIRSGAVGLVVSEVVDTDLRAAADPAADPTLIGELARRHHEVVQAAGEAAGTVLPLRLGTVFADRAAGSRVLAEQADALRHGLDRVNGCREWSVTLREPATAIPPVVAAHQDPPAAAAAAGPQDGARPGGAGTAYLLRRRQMLAAARRARQARDDISAEIAATLRGLAVDSAARRHRDGDVLLQEAFLVRRVDEPVFLGTVERFGDRLTTHGFTMRLSGPWPPYSFTGADMSGAVHD